MSRHPATSAAQYLRMSTEHQNYSIAHQTAAIARYAAGHGLEIVRTYADEGISGLRLAHRDGLKRLLADVMGGAAPFALVLVYDVSRWGRFQDPDQGAHYEFLCREAGVRIEYVAEPFLNDGTLGAVLVKHLKRAMAAEYSRELSAKVSAAKRRLAADGFWVGGPAGYGLRRRLVTPAGEPGPTLQTGEHKHLAGTRSVLVAGPPEEVATVRRIFRLFVVGGMSRAEVSRTLNREGQPAANGAPWTPQRVHQVLTNEKYLGTAVLGRRTGRLGAPVRAHPRADWVTAPGAFEALVDEGWFAMAQRQIGGRNRRRTDQALLDDLRGLLDRHGRLSAEIIRDAEGVACPSLYRRRFGGLVAAYRLIAHAPSDRQARAEGIARRVRPSQFRRSAAHRSDEALLADLRRLLARRGRLTVALIQDADDLEHAETYRKRFGGLRRAYALAGYKPTERQERAMDLKGGQTISRQEAARLTSPDTAPPATPEPARDPDDPADPAPPEDPSDRPGQPPTRRTSSETPTQIW